MALTATIAKTIPHKDTHISILTSDFIFVENKHTRKTTSWAAMLDRFYTNHHSYNQIDHVLHATTLEWHSEVSAHTPIRFTKQRLAQERYNTIPSHNINHPEWASKLRWIY